MARKAHQDGKQLCFACGQTVPTNGHGLFKSHSCAQAGTEIDAATMKVHQWRNCPTHGADYPLVWVLGPYSAYPQCNHPKCDTNGTKGGKPGPWRYQGKARPINGDSEPTPIEDTPESEPPVETESSEAKPSTPSPTSSGFNLKALGSLGDAIQTYVERRAAEIASEMICKADFKTGPIAVEWRVNDKPFAVIDGTHHKALPRLLKLTAAGFRNFLVVGPAGSGKTTLAHNLADSLKLRFGQVSCTSGMSESALTGRAIPNLSNGETAFQTTDFVRCYEAGGVFLIDEVDAADPNVMLVINTALANGHMPLPNRSDAPSATRHPDSVIVCAANTWGTGADRQYVGRNQLDAAFLDRFVGATVEVDYDRDLEASLVGDAHICARVWNIRSKVQEMKLRRVVGTRFLLACTRLVKGAGETLNDALIACTTGWTSDERSKAGILC